MKAINEILAGIPRLEPVTRTLDELMSLTRGHQICGDGASRAAPNARLLHAIIDIEALEASGQSFSQAVELLRQNEETYGRDTLMALSELAQTTPQADVVACAVDSIADGMVLAEDLKTTDGLLLLPRGFEFSQSSRNHIVERFKHRLPERVKVHIAPQPGQKTALRNAS
jgi:hypothetical protein